MRGKIKKIVAICTLMTMVISSAGCSRKTDNLIPEGVEPPSFQEGELPEGTYIRKEAKDDSGQAEFQQLLNQELESDNSGNLFTWFTQPYDDLIPTFEKGDQIIFYSETERPSSYTIYKMTDYGYTLGIMFNVQSNEGDLTRPNIISFGGQYNPTSIVESVVTNAIGNTSAEIQITEINQKDFKSTLLVDDSFLKGLTEQTMYNIGFYCGTVFKEVMVKSDTHLFVQERSMVSSNYTELKDKYFNIDLPANMETGYYFIEGVGLFHYISSENPLEDDEGIDALEQPAEEEDPVSVEGPVPVEDTVEDDSQENAFEDNAEIDDLENEDGNSAETVGQTD